MKINMKNVLLGKSVYLVGSFLILAVVIILLGFWHLSLASGTTITACVNKAGLVFISGEGFTFKTCPKGFQILSWNAEGPQGPQGEKGDQGEQGIQGPKGDTGDAGGSGTSVHLVDADGQDLGAITDVVGDSRNSFVTFQSGYFIDITQDNTNQTVNWRGVSGDRIYFTGQNCEGSVYIYDTPGAGYFLKAGQRIFVPTSAGLQNGLVTLSKLNANGQCSNGSGVDFGVPAEEIANPFSFTEPIAWPLRISSQ